MATVNDIKQIPLSGDKFVDALIDKGPTWNYLLPNNGNVLYYTFTDDGTHTSGISSVTTFNSDQKTAAQDALTYVSSVIGIDFVETSSAAQAQLAFFSANLSDANTAGLTSSESSYSYTSNEVISTYDVDADIFLDVFEFKDNLNPKIGTEGYQVLLHELGHALGLKHPFEGTNQLPEDIDNTNHTLMSYTWTGAPKAEYQEYDLAALWWIYGGDGLGGEYGVNSVYGSTLMQTIVPTANTIGILTLINTTNGRNLTNAQQGDILSASVTDSDGMDNAFFQWLANGIAITGAKNSSYTLTATDVGKTITVTASYTDKLGTAENVVSTATGAVASLGNHLPTGAITISGTATQGQTLAVTNTLADADGLGGMTYVWITNGVATVTANTYTLTQEDVGKTITVAANYIDSMGNSERVFSAATAAVANVNDLPTGAVTISGTATQGQTLTATNTLADIDGLGTIGYQWLANGTAITGAKTSSYTLTATDVGKTITVAASYTDKLGAAENVVSTATGAVVHVTAVADKGTPGNDSNLKGTADNDYIDGLTGNDSLTGLAGNDTLNGGAGNDTLNGGVGSDSMIGGNGSDTYYVDNVGDKVIETASSSGIDLVYSKLSTYTLTTNVEKGTILGTAAATLTGNALNNVLTGNNGANSLLGNAGNDSLIGLAGNDTLNGGLGQDILTGGAGNDIFQFNTALTASNVDKITDFNVTDDSIVLENAIFTKLTTPGILAAANFHASATGTAHDSNDFILYNTKSGALLYDADGSGAGAAIQFAIIGVSLTLTAADFVVS